MVIASRSRKNISVFALLYNRENFSPEQTQNAPKKDADLRFFQFLVWNCLKSIFGQIPEIYKNTKRYNWQYSGNGTSHIKPVFSPDSRCSHDAMRCHPQHSSGNHPYTGEIRIDQIRKKSQNCNGKNNPQRHLYKADKNIQTKPFPFFLPCFKK